VNTTSQKTSFTPTDVDEAVAERSAEHAWAYLGEQGKRIRNVLRGMDEDDDMDAFTAWSKYLEEHLEFPFAAKLTEWQERGPLQGGGLVKAVGIRAIEELYGILVDLRVGHLKYFRAHHLYPFRRYF
jgi:hypothetical protein